VEPKRMTFDELTTHLLNATNASNKDIVESFVVSPELLQFASASLEDEALRDEALRGEIRAISGKAIIVYPNELALLERFVWAVIPSALFPSKESLLVALLLMAERLNEFRRRAIYLSAEETVIYYAVKSAGRQGIATDELMKAAKSEYEKEGQTRQPFVEGNVTTIVSKLEDLGVLKTTNGMTALEPEYLD
jgi:hypothetical protein